MEQEEIEQLPFIDFEQEALNSIERLKNALADVREVLKYMGKDETPNIRILKITEHHYPRRWDDRWNLTPLIRLCGHWLKKAGFECEQHAKIVTINGLLIMYPIGDFPFMEETSPTEDYHNFYL